MAPRDAVETLQDLVGRIKDGKASPVDIMLLWKAMKNMPAADAAELIKETKGGAYAIVPVEPPAEWNAAKKRGYRILLQQAMESLEKMVSGQEGKPA